MTDPLGFGWDLDLTGTPPPPRCEGEYPAWLLGCIRLARSLVGLNHRIAYRTPVQQVGPVNRTTFHAGDQSYLVSCCLVMHGSRPRPPVAEPPEQRPRELTRSTGPR